MYKELYVPRVNELRLMGQKNQINPQKASLLPFYLSVHIRLASRQMNFLYLESFKIKKTEWLAVRTRDFFRSLSNIYDRALISKKKETCLLCDSHAKLI